MTPIKLAPCPFCEGPPCPVVVRGVGGGVFPDSEMEGPDGLYARAFVHCHECGVESESVRDFVFEPDDCKRIEREAVLLWNQRDARHRPLYDSGEHDGLNEYPRRHDQEKQA
jgi:hypothetical protein